jgi:hypothetical protein
LTATLSRRYLKFGAENTRKAVNRARKPCGFFISTVHGRVWANTRPEKGICPPSLRGFQHLVALMKKGNIENFVKEIL